MKRPTLLALVLASLMVATSALVVAVRSGEATSPGVISNVGSPIDLSVLSPKEQHALESTGVTGGPRLLAVRGDRAFYRFAGTGGRTCYAFGRAGDLAPMFGGIACPEGFPTAETPILDQSVVSVGGGAVHLLAVEGIAADGVARVGVIDVKGDLRTAVVTDNVYRLTKLPAVAPRAIVALDASGKQMFSLDLRDD